MNAMREDYVVKLLRPKGVSIPQMEEYIRRALKGQEQSISFKIAKSKITVRKEQWSV